MAPKENRSMKAKKPIKKENVYARKLGDEWMIYDSELEKVHIINSTAEYVWRMCDGSHDLLTIKAKFLEEYDIKDDQQLENDLRQILEKFEQLGVIRG
jgi:hypothetical protein